MPGCSTLSKDLGALSRTTLLTDGITWWDCISCRSILRHSWAFHIAPRSAIKVLADSMYSIEMYMEKILIVIIYNK
jgi:hypothetical protein